MTQPGDRLRRIAARICDATAMERLVDPVLADLRWEHAEALRNGRIWRSRRVRLAGYVAFAKVIAWHGGECTLRLVHGWTADDRRVLMRTLGLAAGVIAAVTLLLELPPLLSVRSWAHSHTLTLALSLIPQALPIAFPIGITLGILYGLGRDVSQYRARAVVLIVAFAASIASFVLVAWIMPAANQAFRTSVAGGSVMNGPNELTLSELGQLLDRGVDTPAGIHPPNDMPHLAQTYYIRWALSFTPFVLACFSIAVVSRRRRDKLTRGIAAAIAIFGYYGVMYLAEVLVVRRSLPIHAVAWLPNVVFVVLTVMLARRPSLTNAPGIS